MKEVQKDPIRAKRLDEVYKHLFAHFGITSQKHLAEVLKVQRTGLSSAFNGNVANLTDNLFKKICAAFPGVFNLNYLLTGEGDLLTLEEGVSSNEFEKQMTQQNNLPPATDQTYIMSKMFETLLKPIESAHTQAVTALNEQIAEKQSRIADLERTIAAKEEIIRARDSRILELERHIAQLNADDLSNYHFPIGAAEHSDKPNI